MINRILIRTRIVQIVYAWYQNRNKDLRTAEKELLFGLQKSYDLYYYLLLLMVELTNAYEARIEAKRNKYLPSDEDLNPNVRLLENRFIRQLSRNKQFNQYLNERPMSWSEHETFVKNLLEEILASETYARYAGEATADYNQDREFWRSIFKQFIHNNEKLDEILEDESIFWNDDIEIVQTFVMKSIRQFSEENGENQRLLPMFKDNHLNRQKKLNHFPGSYRTVADPVFFVVTQFGKSLVVAIRYKNRIVAEAALASPLFNYPAGYLSLEEECFSIKQ
jgi:N utilization substance protein B